MWSRFALGELNCLVISDGQPEPPWEPPLETFFTPDSGVPEQELREAVAREGTGRATLTAAYNCLCVETPGGLAVIDTGLGRSFLGYGPYLSPLVGHFTERLGEAGYSASDLTAVVFTHLHEDHSRGAVWSGEPTFPEATAFAHTAEVAFWTDSVASSLPGLERGAALEAIRLFGERLHPVEYGVEILPRLRTVDAAGHTPGHTAVLLESRGERLLCVGDSFYDPLQLRHPGWRTPWDLDAERSVRSRRRILEWAADENLLVHAYHLPFPGLGRVRRYGDAFEWQTVRP
ncbi:MBL fold metallo-hydrolase [Nonomuraea sp. NPDC050643]|uniref:MBL fold metallo-hydrolase n=1 Tax=Nonomuraea sp. NPDC050643 TaxID=3155660 RepID=UPI0033D69735